ncbi:MAG: glycosyltransferase family 2 protein [Planctomycetes bacterium]|nr:glycosyltransferase family 2 protein [Planctomycetota bacterium]
MSSVSGSTDPRLSIVIPVYNEEATLESIIDRIETVDFPVSTEIVAVDDGSHDGSRLILEALHASGRIDRIGLHDGNRGKGAAIQTALQLARGEWVVIQDADLEYDPHEIPRLLQPVLDGKAEVVYGSRFAGSGPHRVLYFWHFVANRFLTLVSNMFTNLNLTDMETCYKLFARELLEGVELQERRFGVEPELTALFAAAPGARIYEVGISYSGRTYAEGKKIGWRDGVAALMCIIRYNLFRRRPHAASARRRERQPA